MTIVFYQKDATVYAVQYQTSENSLDVSKLEWLFSGAHKIQGDALKSRLRRIWGSGGFSG